MSRGVKDLKATLRDAELEVKEAAEPSASFTDHDYDAYEARGTMNHYSSASKKPYVQSPSFASTVPASPAFPPTVPSSPATTTFTFQSPSSHHQTNYGGHTSLTNTPMFTPTPPLAATPVLASGQPSVAVSRSSSNDSTDLKSKLHKLVELSKKDKEHIALLTSKLAAAREQLEHSSPIPSAKQNELVESLRQSKIECDKLHQLNMTLKRESAMYQERIDGLTQDLAFNQSQLVAAQQGMDLALEHASKLERSFNELQNQSQDQQQSRFVAHEQQAESWAQERTRLEEELKQVRQEKEQLQKMVDSKNNDFDSVSSTHALTQSALKTAHDELLALKSQIRKQQIQQADKESELENTITRLKNENASLTSTNTLLANQLPDQRLAAADDRLKWDAEREKLLKRIAQLSAAHDQHTDGERQGLMRRIQQLEDNNALEKEPLRKRITQLEEVERMNLMTINSLKEELRAKQVEAETRIQTHQRQQLSTEEQQKQQAAALREAQRQLQSTQSVLDLTNKHLEEWKRKCAESSMGYEEDRNSLKARLKKAEDDYAEEIATLKATHLSASNQSKAQIVHLQELLTESETRITRLQQEMKEFESLERKTRVAEKMVAQLQQEAGERFLELQTAKRMLESFKTLREELALSVAKLLNFEQSLAPCLSCTVCTNLFTDPISLPCGHTFCKKCCLRPSQLEPNTEFYSCADCRDAKHIGSVSNRSKSTTYDQQQVIPATNLSIVQGKFIYLRSILGALNAEVEKSKTNPFAASPR